MNVGLGGRVALVTGAHQGIGLACARELAREGATVAAADLPGRECPRDLQGLASWHSVDLRSEAEINGLVREVVGMHGGLHVGVNAGGVLSTAPFVDTTAQQWDEAFAVNARGSFLFGRAVAREMIGSRTRGSIILIGSNMGRRPLPSNAAYGASKAAVAHLVGTMALELARHGIRVNALCPGSTDTAMLTLGQAGGDTDRLRGIIEGSLDAWRTGIPLGRLAETHEQASAVVFLAGDASSFISGQAIYVDGAQTT